MNKYKYSRRKRKGIFKTSTWVLQLAALPFKVVGAVFGLLGLIYSTMYNRQIYAPVYLIVYILGLGVELILNLITISIELDDD